MFLTPAPFLRPGRFFLLSKFPRDRKKAVGGEFKLAVRSAFIPPRLRPLGTYGEPYRIRAGIFLLTNPS